MRQGVLRWISRGTAWKSGFRPRGSCERDRSCGPGAAAHRDYDLAAARPEEWLLIEWPKGEKRPVKYWFSTLSETIAFKRLVDLTKLRWRSERDYHELRQEVGLGHYEGRGWRGFHHHATLSIAAYGFLISPTGRPPNL